MFQNRNTFIIALIAVVNALGYGIIIPVLYSYSLRFGLTDFQNGLLFSLFSICQFLSTPIIGRMSDMFGRRPLLLVSLVGTAASFFIMAFAPNAIFLFIARALDGITAGNIPVVQAVISDTTALKDRAKSFGVIGASFGFGFVFGPLISGLTVGISPQMPFILAGSMSLLAVILTAILLPETNKHIGQTSHGKLFDFSKMVSVLRDTNIGPTMLITLFLSLAFASFIFAFQPFSVKQLGLNERAISFIFVLFGVLGLITQLLIVSRATKTFGLKRTFSGGLLFVALAFLGMFLSKNLITFVMASTVLALANSLCQPLTQALLSRETDEKSQGTIFGISASYMSFGQILGPIIGGITASYSIAYPFLVGSVFALICFILAGRALKPDHHKESAF